MTTIDRSSTRLYSFINRRMSITSAVLIIFIASTSDALRCHQCNGYEGWYPPRATIPSSCDNLNNYCITSQYCVKVTDPIAPDAGYLTYRSDCQNTNTIALSPTSTTAITSGHCYTFQDANIPPHYYSMCFCNNADYCNGAMKGQIHNLYLLMALIIVVIGSVIII